MQKENKYLKVKQKIKDMKEGRGMKGGRKEKG